jgi:hypothetical protein
MNTIISTICANAETIVLVESVALALIATEYAVRKVAKAVRHRRRQQRLASPEYQSEVRARNQAKMAEIIRETSDIYSPLSGIEGK